ncbi:MAG: RAMP superfamily CRISPR-associated protein [Thermaerobacter sp.]|nr:RAMP superfamily CRISPR-associated protein [Thermaerobacter sp.]
MARKLKARLRITGHLVAVSPLRVGGIGSAWEVGLARNGQGKWYIPGTSLAGAMRQWMKSVGLGSEADDYWGPDQAETAAHVYVDDVPALDEVVPEVRDGVGIDRQWGVAAPHVRYTFAALPRGTRFALSMLVELPEGQEANFRALTGSLLRAMQEEKVSFGALKSRGMGILRLERDVEILEQRMDRFEGVLAWLRDGGHRTPLESLGTKSYDSKRLKITIKWHPDGPLLVKAGQEGFAVDILPLVAHRGPQELSCVLPGTSLKGVLRCQAERIVRTVLDLPLPETADSRRRFLGQIESVPLVDCLFGVPKPPEKSNGREEEGGNHSSKPFGQGWQGALQVSDCLAQPQWRSQDWLQMTMTSDEATLQKMLDTPAFRGLQHAFHVAVDRWTGGAASGMLYSVLEPHGWQWEDLRLTLDWNRVPQESRLPALALLLLLLAHLREGWLAFGYGGNRGLGAVEVETISLDGDFPEELEIGDDGQLREFSSLAAVPERLMKQVRDSWRQWQAAHKHVVGGVLSGS